MAAEDADAATLVKLRYFVGMSMPEAAEALGIPLRSADGTGSAALFKRPQRVAVDGAGNVYVGDANNSTIRKEYPTNSVPAPMLTAASLSGGQFGFGIVGLANLAVDVESSGDLSQWQPAGT